MKIIKYIVLETHLHFVTMTKHATVFTKTDGYHVLLIAELLKLLANREVSTVLVFYHKNCPDGIISAVLVTMAKLHPKVVCIPTFYDLPLDEVKQHMTEAGVDSVDLSTVVIEVDVVMTEEGVQDYLNTARGHAKIDHHASQAAITKQIGGICIDTVCAAKIVMEMFFSGDNQLSDAMRHLVWILDQKDRFTDLWKTSRSVQAFWEEIFSQLRFMDSAQELVNTINDFTPEESAEWIARIESQGEAKLAERDAKILHVLRNYVSEAEYDGLAVLVVDFDRYMEQEGCDYKTRENVRFYRSNIADILSSITKKPVFIIATPQKEEEQHILMTSVGSAEGSEKTALDIAKEFGGKQGHKHFAGLQITKDVFAEKVETTQQFKLTAERESQSNRVLLVPN